MGDGQASVKSAVQTELLAYRLKEIRENNGLSLRGFAAGVSKVGSNVSHTSVTDYEGGTPVPADYLSGVCVAYDINPAWLFWGEPPRERRTPAHAERVLEIVRDLTGTTDEEEIAYIQKVIQEMRKDDAR